MTTSPVKTLTCLFALSKTVVECHRIMTFAMATANTVDRDVPECNMDHVISRLEQVQIALLRSMDEIAETAAALDLGPNDDQGEERAILPINPPAGVDAPA